MSNEPNDFDKQLVIFVDILGNQNRVDFQETYKINKIFHEEIEKRILLLAQEKLPEGHRSWNIRLLAEEGSKRGIIDTISLTVVAKILKKYRVQNEVNKMKSIYEGTCLKEQFRAAGLEVVL